MATQIQLRRDSAVNWVSNNPVLAEGEMGIETDGLGTPTVLSKIGNGVDGWNSLPYQDTGVTVDGDMTKAVYDPQNIESDTFDRGNHTGTQEASTISDFDTEVSNNTDVVANTAKRSYPSADETKLAGVETGAEVNTINSTTTGEPTGSDVVLNTVSLTQAEYDAGTPIATTLYIITDA